MGVPCIDNCGSSFVQSVETELLEATDCHAMGVNPIADNLYISTRVGCPSLLASEQFLWRGCDR